MLHELRLLCKKKSFFLLIFFSLAFMRISFPQDGQLDPSFGQNGIVTTVFDNAFHGSKAHAMAMQDDGKIVAAGYRYDGNDRDFFIARYNEDGSFDNSFGLNGVVPLGLSGGRDDEATSIAIQSDGKIVAAGYKNVDTDNNDFALVRLNPDGSLDNSFGADGIVITNTNVIAPNSNTVIEAIAIQSDGKIVVGGWSDFGNSNGIDILFARYNTDGTLDNAFGGGDGFRVYGRDHENEVLSIKIQDDGRIIAAGYSYGSTATLYNFAVVRLAADGSDLEFKNFSISTDKLYDFAFSIGMQSDGKYIIGGHSRTGSDHDITLIRLDYLAKYRSFIWQQWRSSYTSWTRA